MRRLLNDGWEFAFLSSDTPLDKARAAAYTPVSLPHDFLIAHKENLYADADGWYRRILRLNGDGTRARVRFDGVYMDARVFFDGVCVCEHHYGYTAFDVPLGPVDGREHLLEVQIRHRAPNSRWYSGAGIFRDVTLITTGDKGVAPDGLYIRTKRNADTWVVHASCETFGGADGEQALFSVSDEKGNLLCQTAAGVKDGLADARMQISEPLLWSPDAPALYVLSVTLCAETLSQRFGFRETRFDANEGFFLNEEHVKLHGVCLHHDLGALGAAFHEKAARRQLQLMKNMGVNAIRTSHNPPASTFMDLCDEMGLMVVSEAFDMWEIAKTPKDYARFFPTDASADVASWVRRDRNHPSVIMWSIGNEIPDMHASDRGKTLTAFLRDEVKKHDPDENARVTFGSNYMPWKGAQGCAEVIGLPGYNYAEKYYAKHHAEHPDWIIYGSETASILQSRGIYHFPIDHDILSDEDLQCSALLNSKTGWGTQDAARMLEEEEKRPYTLGQFIWSGIDYIGEPTPYHTRSCYFGQADTACFPKDGYALFKAAWSREDVLHIGVYWDFNPGQMVDVPVWTNLEAVELFLNGRSLGKMKTERYRCVFRVPYEEGVLKAVGYGKKGTVTDERSSFGDAYALVIESSDTSIKRDLKDMAFLTVRALDAQGRAVENAVDRVRIDVDGGVLLGVDNGDSTDPDGYREYGKRLFSGKLLIIVAAGEKDAVRVHVSAPGLRDAALNIPCVNAPLEEGRSRIQESFLNAKTEPVRARAIRLISLDDPHLTVQKPSARFRFQVLPSGADPGKTTFKILNADGVAVPCANASVEGDIVTVTAKGDGLFYLRAACDNGEDHPRILSSVGIEAAGFGKTQLDPYTFLSASLSDLRRGEVTAGNEHGVSFARDGRSMIGFSNIDFGLDGSDTLELPIFALDDSAHIMTLWDGDPDDGNKIAALRYQKKSIWNQYQSETYRLPVRLRGMHTLWFSMEEKVHLKGFQFEKQPRAERWVAAGEADRIYGDDFNLQDTAVTGIGNNVTVVFEDIVIEKMVSGITIDGATDLPMNPINLLVSGPQGEETFMLRFAGTGKTHARQHFPMCLEPGRYTFSFVFLPGCRFDFDAFFLQYENVQSGGEKADMSGEDMQ